MAVFDVGRNRENGKSRQDMIELRDNNRKKVLEKTLKECDKVSCRAVWSWNQRDKLSTAWLLALPGPHTGMSSTIFVEGLATVLCLPSPACVRKLGEKIGKKS